MNHEIALFGRNIRLVIILASKKKKKTVFRLFVRGAGLMGVY